MKMSYLKNTEWIISITHTFLIYNPKENIKINKNEQTKWLIRMCKHMFSWSEWQEMWFFLFHANGAHSCMKIEISVFD